MGRTTDAALAALLLFSATGCPTATTPPSGTPSDTDTTPSTSTAATGDTGTIATVPVLPDEDWQLFGDPTYASPTSVGGLAADDLDGDGVAELLVEIVADRYQPDTEGIAYTGWSGAAVISGLPSPGAIEDVARTTWRMEPTYSEASHECGAPGAPGDVTGDGVLDVTVWCEDNYSPGWGPLHVLDSSAAGERNFDLPLARAAAS